MALTKIQTQMVGTGGVVQVTSTISGALVTGSTALPSDDTIPQNTEGVECMTLAITPKATTNTLKIDVVVFGANADSARLLAALFQDSTANALAAGQMVSAAAGNCSCIKFSHVMTAGTTSATTFKVRTGSASGVTTFNGAGGARLMGGVMASSIVITEYAV